MAMGLFFTFLVFIFCTYSVSSPMGLRVSLFFAGEKISVIAKQEASLATLS